MACLLVKVKHGNVKLNYWKKKYSTNMLEISGLIDLLILRHGFKFRLESVKPYKLLIIKNC